ncbi:MAG: putative formate dehydrogenase [Firmicutes bacterium]|nr:putative formate dehydrogenase [Bacillota bacterium]
MEMINLTINGLPVQVRKGSSVLEAARSAGINIPTLCHLADLTPEGSCRVCVVEVEGARGLVTACTYPVSVGMIVRTNSAVIREARKSVVELMLANHPQECLSCQRNLDCELQTLANTLGIREIKYEGERRQFVIDDSNPFIIRDNNKCILCGRCVRVCKEIQCCNTLDWTERGFDTKVTPAFDADMVDSPSCVFCGTCVSACPVGALTEKAMNGVGRPDKKVKTTCPFCGVGCNYDLNVKDGKLIGVTSNLTSVVNGRITCVKGRFGTDYVHSPERLTTPLIKKNGEFVEASWDEALDLIVTKFTEIKNTYGSDALAAVSSARCVNEENYIMQKFIRAAIGTNNVDHCARICHAPTVAGLATSFGSGAMTNSINELPESKMIFLIGGNPTEAHPAIGAKMRQALRNGAKLIVADPRRIELAAKAHVWLQLTPGTDIALINGMMHIILKNGWHDQEFINQNTTGFDQVAEVVEKYTPDYVEKITGVPKHLLFEAAKMYATAERASIFYTLGITEHTCGTDNVMSLANLAMLTGNVGKLYSGVNPMRGQNNVQGSCDMGALPNVYSGYQKVNDPQVQGKFEKAWGVNLSDKVGYMLPDMIDASIAGKLKAMYVMGEDPIRSDGDAHHVRKGFEHLEFLVVQNIFMTETGKLADVILPAASFAEKDGTFTNCERRVQRVRQAIEPIGNSRPDWQIIRDLSNKMGYTMSYSHPSEIMDEMASLSPMFAGLSFERIDENGLQWPVPTKEHPGTQYLHVDGKFTCGLGVFKAIEHQSPAELPDDEYPFLLTTGRILYHYCITTAGYSKQLTEYRPEERAMIHPDDAKRLNIADKELITVTSRRGTVQAKAWVTNDVLPGGIWMSFHYQECPTNEITSGCGDKVTKTYEYKVCAVKVAKAAAV